MLKFKNKKILLLPILFLILMTSGFKCGAPPTGLTPGKPTSITLNYWDVYEEKSNISELIGLYAQLHPEVSINYRDLSGAEYKDELLNALAEDRGPDIFSIQTAWTREYLTKILPLPAQITIPYAVEQGTIKKETFTQMRTEKTLTLRDIRQLYPDVVYDNQVVNNQIVGLPLSIDTLALFYNRDLLNNAGIQSPPKDWDEFKEQVKKLTHEDGKGNIIQAGAAIGTASNINNAPDILSLLLMQNGAGMTDSSGFATFDKIPAGDTRGFNPGVQALDFYNSFASPSKETYTWNDRMPQDLSAFMAGKTAFYFGYSYDLALIKAQAPALNFDVVKVPQIKNSLAPSNFANYWIDTVSTKSKHPDQAWNFILFLATNLEANKKYLDTTRKPTALRSFIQTQLDDLTLAPFADQILSARSWYKGRNAAKMEEILKSMINDNLAGAFPTDRILELGVQRINIYQ